MAAIYQPPAVCSPGPGALRCPPFAVRRLPLHPSELFTVPPWPAGIPSIPPFATFSPTAAVSQPPLPRSHELAQGPHRQPAGPWGCGRVFFPFLLCSAAATPRVPFSSRVSRPPAAFPPLDAGAAARRVSSSPRSWPHLPLPVVGDPREVHLALLDPNEVSSIVSASGWVTGSGNAVFSECAALSKTADYRYHQERLQMPSWNPYCSPQESPEMVSSAYLCGSVSTASPPLSSVVSPSSFSVWSFPPPRHRPHRITMLSLGHARRIRRFHCPRAPHPLFSMPPTLPPSRLVKVALLGRGFIQRVRNLGYNVQDSHWSRSICYA